jgi:putative transposase
MSTPQDKPLPTIWRVPDELWHNIQAILDQLDPPAKTGRPRIDPRAALEAMIYRMRTGCQWNGLPKDFPDDASVHRTMQRWIEGEVFSAIWAFLVEVCDELGGVDFEWQAVDGAMGKLVSVGMQRAPTPPIGAKRA